LVGDANTNGPVGTTLALIEQGLKVMSGIHMRLHRSQQHELHRFAELCYETLPEDGYPYEVPGQDRTIMAQDFDERVDVIPVSDPNVVSATHRIALAQAVMDLANGNPDLYDIRKVNHNMLIAMRVQNPDEIMPPEQPPPRADPVTEGTAMLTGGPVKAYEDQDHTAHIIVHQDLLERVPEFVGAAGSKKRSEIQTVIMSHIAEHVAMQTMLMYQQAMGQQIPPGEEMSPEIENQIAMMAAQAAQLMPKPEPPDPNEGQAAQMAMQDELQRKRAEMDDERARADIRRKDAIAASDLERKNAALSAELNRKNTAQEADLLQRFLSENAKATMAAQPDIPQEKPMA
jgi:Skp family chaperone for outer membrane proteins